MYKRQAVADEVPPHEDLRTERCATQQQHPRARVELQLQAVAAVAQVGQFVHREMLAAHFQPAFQRQQAVLEVRVERQLQGRGVVAGQVGTEQRRVEPARRLSPGQRTGQQGEGDPLLLPCLLYTSRCV